MTSRFILKTKALPYSSRRLTKAAMAVLSEVIDSRDHLFHFDLALSEACANVVRHAYKNIEPGDLEIAIQITPGVSIEIEVSDWGLGFSRWPVYVKNAEPHAEGGRGLFIMSELADTFEIRQDQGRHSVYMKINIEEESWKTA